MRPWGPFSFYNRFIKSARMPQVTHLPNLGVSPVHRQPEANGGLLGGFAALEYPFIRWLVMISEADGTTYENL